MLPCLFYDFGFFGLFWVGALKSWHTGWTFSQKSVCKIPRPEPTKKWTYSFRNSNQRKLSHFPRRIPLRSWRSPEHRKSYLDHCHSYWKSFQQPPRIRNCKELSCLFSPIDIPWNRLEIGEASNTERYLNVSYSVAMTK